MKTPHVWVIEMWNNYEWSDHEPQWEPCAEASTTREDAKDCLREWRKKNPHDRFRIAKYVRGAK